MLRGTSTLDSSLIASNTASCSDWASLRIRHGVEPSDQFKLPLDGLTPIPESVVCPFEALNNLRRKFLSTISIPTFSGFGLERTNFLILRVSSCRNSRSVPSFRMGPITAPMSNGVGISISPDSNEVYPSLILCCSSEVSKYSSFSVNALSVPPLILLRATSGSQSTQMQRSGTSAAEFMCATLSTPSPPTIPWYTNEECMFLSLTTALPSSKRGSIQPCE